MEILVFRFLDHVRIMIENFGNAYSAYLVIDQILVEFVIDLNVLIAIFHHHMANSAKKYLMNAVLTTASMVTASLVPL